MINAFECIVNNQLKAAVENKVVVCKLRKDSRKIVVAGIDLFKFR